MSTAYQSADLASIQFLNGPQMGRIFPINKATIKIGRDAGNDIVVSDPTVSRFHAQLTYKGSLWSIEKLSTTNSLFVNSRSVYTAIVIDQDTIRMGSGPSFLFITGKALQPYSPYPQQSYSPVSPPSPQRKADAKVMWIVLGCLGIILACFVVSPLLISVLIVLAIPVLFIWALVTVNNKPKPYTVPYTLSYPVLSQSVIYQEQHVAYDSYNTENSYNTEDSYNTENSYNTNQQIINVYCENFIYYGQPPRGMIGNRIVVDEDEDEEDEEDEEEVDEEDNEEEDEDLDYWPHGQTINYELQAYKYVSETLLREMLRRTNYRCEECGKIYSVLSPWFYETPNEGGRVEPDNLIMLCISCGHEYGLKNS